MRAPTCIATSWARAWRETVRRYGVRVVAPVGSARFSGVHLRDVVESVDVLAEPARLTTPGWWALVGEFEGRVRAWRFADASVPPEPAVPSAVSRAVWEGPDRARWTSSMSRAQYLAAVREVRARVRAGDVYQANLCRVLSAPLGSLRDEPDALALADVLGAGNPAPFAGHVHVPHGQVGLDPVWVVTASPELFLRLENDVLTSSPIKGTAEVAAGLTAKDTAENVMITDLVRNDLQHVCRPATVEVTTLLGVEEHPGLVHLVSTVQGVLRPDVAAAGDLWAQVLDATYPPGSVSGAPKSSALRVIAELEPVPRGSYCGLVGWLHVAQDGRTRAELAVGIRTFWWTADAAGVGLLHFGTGAGITWGSDPQGEWAETELKAARLVALASGSPAGAPGLRD